MDLFSIALEKYKEVKAKGVFQPSILILEVQVDKAVSLLKINYIKFILF